MSFNSRKEPSGTKQLPPERTLVKTARLSDLQGWIRVRFYFIPRDSRVFTSPCRTHMPTCKRGIFLKNRAGTVAASVLPRSHQTIPSEISSLLGKRGQVIPVSHDHMYSLATYVSVCSTYVCDHSRRNVALRLRNFFPTEKRQIPAKERVATQVSRISCFARTLG